MENLEAIGRQFHEAMLEPELYAQKLTTDPEYIKHKDRVAQMVASAQAREKKRFEDDIEQEEENWDEDFQSRDSGL
jgi:hypothetical protein